MTNFLNLEARVGVPECREIPFVVEVCIGEAGSTVDVSSMGGRGVRIVWETGARGGRKGRSRAGEAWGKSDGAERRKAAREVSPSLPQSQDLFLVVLASRY